MTFSWAVTHGYLLGLPVNLWVVLHKPGEAEDDILPSEIGDWKCGPLQVTIEVEDHIYNLGDGPLYYW